MIEPVSISSFSASRGVFALVFGLPGKGKTSCCRGFPKDSTVFISSEPTGLLSLRKFGWTDVKVICPTTVAGFDKAVNDVLTDESCKHIVVDTLSQYYEYLLKAYIETSGKPVASCGIDMYRTAGLQFQKMMRSLLDALPAGKDVIGLVHMNYKEADEGEAHKIYREPALPGQLPQWTSRQAGLVLRAESVRMGQNAKYMLLLDQSEGDYGKDIYGVAASTQDNDLWALLSKVDRSTPPAPVTTIVEVPPALAPEVPAEPNPYVELMKLAARCSVSKAELDSFMSARNVDPRSATVERMREIWAEFKTTYDFPG